VSNEPVTAPLKNRNVTFEAQTLCLINLLWVQTNLGATKHRAAISAGKASNSHNNCLLLLTRACLDDSIMDLVLRKERLQVTFS